MTLALLPLQHDYLVLSLSNLRAPVVVIDRPVVGIQVVEGLQGLLVTEEEFSGPVETEAQLAGAVVEEESLSATVETEDMAATIVQVDDMAAVFEECP